jgi:hypothetical protein
MGGLKSKDSEKKNENIITVPPCPPLSSIKEYKKSDIRRGNNSISNANSINENYNSRINNKEKWGDRGDSKVKDTSKTPITLSKTQKIDVSPRPPDGEQREAIPNHPDSRFKDSNFRASVRVVLEYLGLESTVGNFKRHDFKTGGVIRNWPLFADRILHPRFIADVLVKGSYAVIGIELPGCDESEALGNLDTRCYEFIKWA